MVDARRWCTLLKGECSDANRGRLQSIVAAGAYDEFLRPSAGGMTVVDIRGLCHETAWKCPAIGCAASPRLCC